jgi:hypothetical protein
VWVCIRYEQKYAHINEVHGAEGISRSISLFGHLISCGGFLAASSPDLLAGFYNLVPHMAVSNRMQEVL